MIRQKVYDEEEEKEDLEEVNDTLRKILFWELLFRVKGMNKNKSNAMLEYKINKIKIVNINANDSLDLNDSMEGMMGYNDWDAKEQKEESILLHNMNESRSISITLLSPDMGSSHSL